MHDQPIEVDFAVLIRAGLQSGVKTLNQGAAFNSPNGMTRRTRCQVALARQGQGAGIHGNVLNFGAIPLARAVPAQP